MAKKVEKAVEKVEETTVTEEVASTAEVAVEEKTEVVESVETKVEETVVIEEPIVESVVVEEPVSEAVVAETPIVEEISAPAEKSFVAADYTDKFAETAVVAEASPVVADAGKGTKGKKEKKEKKPLKVIHFGKGPCKYNKVMVFISYFALILGAIIIATSSGLNLKSARIGDVIGYISQLLAYSIIAVIAVNFTNHKKFPWLVAYIIAVLVIVVFVVLPTVFFFTGIASNASNQIISLFAML